MKRVLILALILLILFTSLPFGGRQIAAQEDLPPIPPTPNLPAGHGQADGTSKMDAQVQADLASLAEGEMTTVIITMRQQADLSQIPGSDRAARQQGVITALQAQAEASQRSIRAEIEWYRMQGQAGPFSSFWVFNGLSLTATSDVINELAARSDVLALSPDAIDIKLAALQTGGSTETNISLVNAPAMWSLGYAGQGVVIASMDSGVDLSHADLSATWRGGSNSWYDPYGQHPTTPADLIGHGTQTMGVMVGGSGGGTDIGMAPQAQWIAVKIFDDQGGSTSTAIHQGFQWLLDPDGNPGTADGPQIVNNSWTMAYPGCDLSFELDLQALRAADILPVFAAGNGGPNPGSDYSPANNPSALAVGATNNDDLIDGLSSRGPSACDQTTFPEMVAPGVGIHTTDLAGFYTDASGTSLAAPHVSGGLALLLSAFSDFPVADQQAALLNSAVDLGPTGPDNDYGNGRLDVLAAYQWLQQNPPGATPTPTPIANANLALNRPVVVSSFEDDAHAGSYAVDGDPATFWKTARAKGKNKLPSEWISVDLGGDITIGQVILGWSDNFATSYEIQVSSDNNAWSYVYGTTAGDGGTDTISFSPVTARYLRLVSTAWSSGSLRNWLQELEIYPGDGGPPPTATATPTPPPMATSTPMPTNTPTPGPTGSVHVGDLDGSAVQGSRNRWDATVKVVIHDQSHLPVAGMLISGSWSSGASGTSSCTTGASGSCTLTETGIKGNAGSVVFTVDQVQGGSLTYQPGNNHDPDGDSGGTDITIAQP
jgi:subtilisin family serine protease